MAKKDKKEDIEEQKSIADILDIEDIPFDDDEAHEAESRQQMRLEELKKLKDDIEKMKNSTNADEFADYVMKEIAIRGLTMIATLQMELEENPNGVDIGYVSTAISSIANSIAHMKKYKNNDDKMVLEREKLEVKKLGISKSGPNKVTNNIVMINSTQGLLDMLEEGGVIDQRGLIKDVDDISVKDE